MTNSAARPLRTVELVVDAKASLGEGPLWSVNAGRLYWLDIYARQIHCTDPADGSDRWVEVPGLPGALVERSAGGFAIAWEHGFGPINLEHGTIDPWCDPETDLPGNRFNDGKVDAAGRFWAGTMSKIAPHAGQAGLYRLDPDRRVQKMLSGVSISNGLAWSADGRTLYYIDTPTDEIAAFPVDPVTGSLGQRRVAIRKHNLPGWFDGMCIDAEGALWVGHWAGHCLTRWDPIRGELLEKIEFPVPNVTSCCFGGERLDTLFVTTASDGVDPVRFPLAGGVFQVPVGAIGLPSTPFAG